MPPASGKMRPWYWPDEAPRKRLRRGYVMANWASPRGLCAAGASPAVLYWMEWVNR